MMRSVIEKGLSDGKYIRKDLDTHTEAYVNQRNGWTLFLLNDNIVFSHRADNYLQGALTEWLHVHDFYELTINASLGNVEYIAEGQNLFLSHGMAVLTKPNHFHMFRLPIPLQYERYVIYFKKSDILFSDPRVMEFSTFGTIGYAVFDLSGTHLLETLNSVETILHEHDVGYSSAEAYLSLGQLFLALCKCSSESNPNLSKITVPPFLSEIKAYVDKNYSTISSVDALATKFFYSREYLSRTFKKYYNTPLYKYILSKKILLCQTLLQTAESVESSAKQSGFSNMSSFVKIFKQHTGVTPSVYKATKQKIDSSYFSL